jgi:chromosome segregation protein
MYLQRLELHGFKSFADKTVVHFASGVTAIVGPNGCGKSNIIDAVRWVLGEQRARLLRAERMDNVIFNGAADRRRLGMAEVTMTVENTRHVLPTEYTEVQITRRLYRSGESDYLLNGRPCRLKDIQDLFMDTGMGAGAYSVIELKMIEDILSDNAQDRRRLFEEAAGITKYKLRRTQALRKLDATQADLTRIRDIVDEVSRNVRSLERQARKAARHRELSDEWRKLSLTVARSEYDALSGERDVLDKERGALDDRIQELTAQQAGEDARLEARRKELLDLERRLAVHQQELNEHVDAIRRLESEVRVQEERASAAKSALERALREKEDAERRAEELETGIGDLAEKEEEIRPKLETATEALREAEAKRDRLREEMESQRRVVESLREKEEQTRSRRSDLQHEQARLSNRIEMFDEEKERLQDQARTIEEGLAEINERKNANKDQLEAADGEVSEHEAALRAAEARLLGLQRDIESAQGELHDLERRREGLKAEATLLESLLLSQEEAGEAVQFLAGESDWRTGSASTVADVMACDEEYAVAVEHALGDLANCLVVQSDREVDAALKLLRKSDKGSATFVVLDNLVPPPAPSDPLDDVRAAPLADVVRTGNKKVKALAEILFRDAYIVEDLQTARALVAEYGANRGSLLFVSRAGEWADGLGRVYGGGTADTDSTASRIGRKERLAGLHDEIKRLAARCVQHESSLENLRSEAAGISVGALRMKVRDAEQIRARVDQERARIESEAANLSSNLSAVAERAETVTHSQSSDREQLSEVGTEIESLAEQIAAVALERQDAQQSFQETESESRSAEAAHGSAHVAALEIRHTFETIERDRRRMASDLDDLALRAERREEEMSELEAQIAAANARRHECREEIVDGYKEKEGFDKAVAEAETAVNDLRSAISDQDVVLREVRRLREAAMQDEGSRMTRLAEIKTRLEDLVERIRSDFDYELAEVEPEVDPDFDLTEARQKAIELRDRLRNMGAVNELALETYEEEKERLDFLSEQQADLEQAEKTLVDTIEEINTTASERFQDTFAKIQANFSRLFERLFGEGASAQLSIPEDGDPLEAPIDIIARPRGKKNVIISQLSGGEKALTATALLFAIYLVKPSPFCILDEVDAPLDDANVERFMELLHDFSETTQFILVTHNKLTMEAADRMYGITMEQQGVSKLVGVTFDEGHPDSEAA